jgi:hypothetical protein
VISLKYEKIKSHWKSWPPNPTPRKPFTYGTRKMPFALTATVSGNELRSGLGSTSISKFVALKRENTKTPIGLWFPQGLRRCRRRGEGRRTRKSSIKRER